MVPEAPIMVRVALRTALHEALTQSLAVFRELVARYRQPWSRIDVSKRCTQHSMAAIANTRCGLSIMQRRERLSLLRFARTKLDACLRESCTSMRQSSKRFIERRRSAIELQKPELEEQALDIGRSDRCGGPLSATTS